MDGLNLPMAMHENLSRRLLVVDDNPAIHADIRKILASSENQSVLDSLAAELFDTPAAATGRPAFAVDSTHQGQEALRLVERADAEDNPYCVAVVDMRMPPGWDGLETIERLWRVDPRLQVIICTAFSDHAWQDIAERLDVADRLLVLKKPFDAVELIQMTHALSHKWALARENERHLATLEQQVRERTRSLEDANLQLQQEMAKRERMEAELRLAQKLEAVGQLAAGVAHEINTPIQYVGDNVRFLQEAYADLQPLLDTYRQSLTELTATPAGTRWQTVIDTAEQEADLEFLREEAPAAFANALEGIDRVATIVRAMKEFAHHDQGEQSDADLNRALQNTLEVARNEYKTVAEVVTDWGRLPPVRCYASDLNQVFLNLIVNAAHAIGDARGDGRKGEIRVSTRQADGQAVITIADNGCGIPEAVRGRVFDPFFTTKEVGKGTGQGLAIAHAIVVDKHRGRLTFASEPGHGTVFTVRLPLHGAAADANPVDGDPVDGDPVAA